MNKLMTVLMILLGAAVTTQAQVTLERSVIGAAGFVSPTMSFTIGEVVTTTATDGTIVLTQGFQQPDTVLRVGISNIPDATIAMQLYPNPTNSHINLKFINANNDAVYTISVKNILGEDCLALPAVTTDAVSTIDVSSLSSGMYFLRVDDGQHHSTIIKFQKID